MTELIDRGHFVELAQLDPRDVSRRALCSFVRGQNCYTLPVWNRICTISPGQGTVLWRTESDRLHEYFDLFAVHYLLTAREISPSGQWISEKDMMGGATFFRGPHAIPTHLIANRVNNSVDAFRSLCTAYGGAPLAMADAAYSFSITDRIPVAVLYWAGDDEFPAEAKLLFDKTLPKHFALDIIFALAVGVCEELGNV